MSKTIAFRDGDYFVQANGRMLLIEDSDKADQDLAEVLTTKYIEGKDYGNELYGLVGSPLPGSRVISKTFVAEKIRQCVERLSVRQQQDPNLSEHEELGDIEVLRVVNGKTRTNFGYYLSVKTASGQIVGNAAYEVSLRQSEPILPGVSNTPNTNGDNN